jgi:hypothetical protein
VALDADFARRTSLVSVFPVSGEGAGGRTIDESRAGLECNGGQAVNNGLAKDKKKPAASMAGLGL